MQVKGKRRPLEIPLSWADTWIWTKWALLYQKCFQIHTSHNLLTGHFCAEPEPEPARGSCCHKSSGTCWSLGNRGKLSASWTTLARRPVDLSMSWIPSGRKLCWPWRRRSSRWTSASLWLVVSIALSQIHFRKHYQNKQGDNFHFFDVIYYIVNLQVARTVYLIEILSRIDILGSIFIFYWSIVYPKNIGRPQKIEPIDFQQHYFQNGRLAAILDFSVSGFWLEAYRFLAMSWL